MKKKLGTGGAAIKNAFGAPQAVSTTFKVPMAPQMISKLLQGREDSEYVLSFEIGQQECGLYSAQTDRATQYCTYLYIDNLLIKRMNCC